jgi:HipA-like C-terminal domain
VRSRDVNDEPIRWWNDHQLNWNAIFPPLPNGKFFVDKLRSMQGDAPKSFIRIREHLDGRTSGKNSRRRRITRNSNRWPGYIAKVGSKLYPIESITEHLLTRIGQTYGLRMADSHLRIVGNQVRFLSRYFLSRDESLYHGIDLFKSHLDSEMVEEIAQRRIEQEFYTFQTVCTAVEERFPGSFDEIIGDLVEMLTVDALVGNNDRHPANWGVITPTRGQKSPRFSPVFDTARALFWNVIDRNVQAILRERQRFDSYVRRSVPQIGWDHCERVGHFELIHNIHAGYPN